MKKQKRLLSDTLKNLHAKFVKENVEYKHMSYTLFSRLRPFWIVFPKVAERDTCGCKKHSNMSLLVAKLKHLKMVNETINAEIKKDERIEFKEYKEDEEITYEQWKTVKETVNVRGTDKRCQKTIKESLSCTKKDCA